MRTGELGMGETGVGPSRNAGARRREAGSKDFSVEKYL